MEIEKNNYYSQDELKEKQVVLPHPPSSKLTVDLPNLQGLTTEEKLYVIENMERISKYYDDDEILCNAALTNFIALVYWKRAKGEIRDMPEGLRQALKEERQHIEASVQEVRGVMLHAADYQRQFTVTADRLLAALNASSLSNPESRNRLLHENFRHLVSAFFAGVFVGGFGVLVFLGLGILFLQQIAFH